MALLGASPPPGVADYPADARALDAEIARRYAYLDRFPGGTLPSPAPLAAERERVHDRDSLLRHAEHRLRAPADHHAITARSFADDWALVPSYADLWVERSADGRYLVDAVRQGGPAGIAGVVVGDRLVAVDGMPVERAVATFWEPIGRPPVADADSFAARVLAAGRRDRPRVLTFASEEGERTLTLPWLYATAPPAPRPPLSCGYLPPHKNLTGLALIHLFDLLGDQATVAAFDACMARLAPGDGVSLDLTDTPSGGKWRGCEARCPMWRCPRRGWW